MARPPECSQAVVPLLEKMPFLRQLRVFEHHDWMAQLLPLVEGAA
jgi:hypothetical protein